MPFKSLLRAGAASLILFAGPAGAQPSSSQEDAEVLREAERTADEAVAEARAEVVAEARADANPQGESEEIVPVTISDVREGSRVHDRQGGLVGTIESVNENGAVVSTGRVRARLPFSSFGKNGAGLVISLTRAQLEAEAARTAS